MPTNSEASSLNLEYYRKQAKALLKAARSGDSSAVQRLTRPAPKLSDAQFVIAREQGFPSWPRFKAFILQSCLDFKELVTAFIDAALSDARHADEMLVRDPEIADAGLYAALVLGDYRVVCEIDDTAKTVDVTRIAHQREVYE